MVDRDACLLLREVTGEGLLACHRALKESNGDYNKALDMIRRSGRLVSQTSRKPTMTTREAFEAFWSKKYEWEMKRGVRGRGGYSLDMYEGEYVSDKAKFAYEIWLGAKGEENEQA